jgi:hypothetical protein
MFAMDEQSSDKSLSIEFQIDADEDKYRKESLPFTRNFHCRILTIHLCTLFGKPNMFHLEFI